MEHQLTEVERQVLTAAWDEHSQAQQVVRLTEQHLQRVSRLIGDRYGVTAAHRTEFDKESGVLRVFASP